MISARHSIRVRKAIVVMAMTGLLGVAASSQLRSVNKAREAVLREDLHTVRTAINSYTRDRGQAPQSLEELVLTGYLKTVPGAPPDKH
ncbi:hypothetical protein [Granulicella sp. S156]|uniref:hypothetical protein n=1 Tax=Granulicella sp. S156 TaxID=1747224 RepID=UPI00131BFE6F|nr:hypothetical protein [Granulicella sp. S156]